MASGSVKSSRVCKPAEGFTFNITVNAQSRKMATANNAGYTIPTGYLGITAGFTGETTASTNSTTPVNYINPRATGTANFFGIRNNSDSTNHTRHIKTEIVFVKGEFVDDRR